MGTFKNNEMDGEMTFMSADMSDLKVGIWEQGKFIKWIGQ